MSLDCVSGIARGRAIIERLKNSHEEGLVLELDQIVFQLIKDGNKDAIDSLIEYEVYSPYCSPEIYANLLDHGSLDMIKNTIGDCFKMTGSTDGGFEVSWTDSPGSFSDVIGRLKEHNRPQEIINYFEELSKKYLTIWNIWYPEMYHEDFE